MTHNQEKNPNKRQQLREGIKEANHNRNNSFVLLYNVFFSLFLLIFQQL
jgi:hypothetical protein